MDKKKIQFLYMTVTNSMTKFLICDALTIYSARFPHGTQCQSHFSFHFFHCPVAVSGERKQTWEIVFSRQVCDSYFFTHFLSVWLKLAEETWKVLCESIGYIAYNSLPFVFKITASISITVILDIENFPSCFLLNFPSIRIHQHINCVWFISTVKDITIYDVYSAIYVLVGQCDL